MARYAAIRGPGVDDENLVRIWQNYHTGQVSTTTQRHTLIATATESEGLRQALGKIAAGQSAQTALEEAQQQTSAYYACVNDGKSRDACSTVFQ